MDVDLDPTSSEDFWCTAKSLLKCRDDIDKLSISTAKTKKSLGLCHLLSISSGGNALV